MVHFIIVKGVGDTQWSNGYHYHLGIRTKRHHHIYMETKPETETTLSLVKQKLVTTLPGYLGLV